VNRMRTPWPNSLTVIVEFDIEAEEQRPLREGIERLTREVTSKQPGFVGAYLHVSRDGRRVLHFVEWDSLEAFERFRDDDDVQRRISQVIGPYGPKTRVYDVVTTTGSSSPPANTGKDPIDGETPASEHIGRRLQGR
jgi:heme-degrading monooxygenase HmoA